MNSPVVIEGFKCYSPELAIENDGFAAESFSYLEARESTNFWFTSRNRVIKNLVKKYTGNREKKFLEIGCGTGFVLSGLEPMKNLRLMGSEIHLEGLKFAKQRLHDVELVQLDATQMPFQNEFDAIGAFDVIEHITEDEKVLKNIHGSLKEDGIVYISVPQYMFMWSYLDDIAFHKRRYAKRELKKKIQEAGFRVEYISGFVFALFPLMLMSRLLKKKGSAETADAELETGFLMNKILSAFMRLDEFFISLGVGLPWGGSLIAVGKKINK